MVRPPQNSIPPNKKYSGVIVNQSLSYVLANPYHEPVGYPKMTTKQSQSTNSIQQNILIKSPSQTILPQPVLIKKRSKSI